MVKFSVIEEGINIHLYGTAGKEARDVKTTVIPGEAAPKTGVEYELDQAEAMLITAYPSQGSSKTNFVFEFWVVGEEYSELEHYYNEYIASKPNGDRDLAVLTASAAGLGCVLLACLLCCVWCCKRACQSTKAPVKATDDETNDGDEDGKGQDSQHRSLIELANQAYQLEELEQEKLQQQLEIQELELAQVAAIKAKDAVIL